MKKEESTIVFPETDPRSRMYNRVLAYPTIKYGRVLLQVAILAILLAVLFLLRQAFNIRCAISIPVICLLVCWTDNFKKMIILAVQIYQVSAPKKIRMKCRFEPSCSQYFILAVEKYGTIKGVAKGIRRLSKCNSRGKGMNGGIDYP